MNEFSLFHLLDFLSRPENRYFLIVLPTWLATVAIIVFILNRKRERPKTTWALFFLLVGSLYQAIYMRTDSTIILAIEFILCGLLTRSALRIMRSLGYPKVRNSN